MCGCILALVALITPRFVLIVLWLTTDYLSRAYDGWLLPFLGFFFLPLTTLAGAWSIHTYGGIEGFGLIAVILAALIDLGVIGGSESARQAEAQHRIERAPCGSSAILGAIRRPILGTPHQCGRRHGDLMIESGYQQRLADLWNVVGNTPLLAIDLKFDGRHMPVFAEAENANFTGSIKDRMALHVIGSAYERGELTPGVPIAEATSGNTGISFAAVGRALGHPVTIFMPDWMSEERVALMRSFGANVRLVGRHEEGFLGCLRLMQDFAEENVHCYLPDQFGNADNVDAHDRTTGAELWWQLRLLGLQPDAFVAGVGTGGTIMGVGRHLRRQDPRILVHPVEPSNSPTLTTGAKQEHGSHRIQGISDDFIPPICDLKLRSKSYPSMTAIR